MRLALVLALAAVLPAPAAAQRSVKVDAVLSSGLVKLGGAARIKVEVQNANEARIVGMPEVEGLAIERPGAAIKTSFSQFINGRHYSKNSLEWSIGVRPLRTGDFTIPPLRLIVDGEEMTAPADEMVLKVVTDLKGEELGFFEIVDAPLKVYEGQPFTIDLRFGFDDRLMIRRLGLLLPWWGSLPGTLEIVDPPSTLSGEWYEIAVNGRYKVNVQKLDLEERSGRQFQPLRLKRKFVATRSADLEFPTSSFAFAQLLERGRGFNPDKVEEFYNNLPGFTIDVLPVPEEGRPFEWTGAVGSLEATRRVDRRDVDEGDSVKLTVSWTGPANLEFFDPPDISRMDAFAGFRVLGTEEAFLGDERRVTYDLVPVSGEVTEIPPVPLWTFDPELEAYRVVETDPVSLRVRALEGPGFSGTGEEEVGEVLDIRDIKVRPSGRAVSGPGGAWVLGAMLGVPLLWLAGRTVVRRRGDPDAPIERRRRAARRVLAHELRSARGASDQTRALTGFLAARTREAEQAWVGRDPALWREETGAGVEPATLDELALLLRELDERAYARGDEPVEARRVTDVAARLMQGGL